jgi:hypothetical protein
MQRWEYRYVSGGIVGTGGLSLSYVDGERPPSELMELSFSDYLQRLGNEGWELVGIDHEGEYARTAYFKRPKESQANP